MGRLGLFLGHGHVALYVIVSPGYFAQKGQWELVAMFAVLLILTVVSVFRVV